MKDKTASVFVAIIGRPNVGKSSLLNRLVGEKTAIVTHKPQTTRTRITGILTKEPIQYVFIDTPGIHVPRTKLGKHMSKVAEDSVGEGDVTLMLFEPEDALRPVELEMAKALAGKGGAIAAINKADTVQLGEVLMKKAAELESLKIFSEVRVISAASGEGCEELLESLAKHAVAGPHFFADDAFTDQPERQLVAEIIREKLLLHLQEEIPHGTAVEVESFSEREDGKLIDINATIYCEKKSHKGMVIGKGGQMLKQVASEARRDTQEMLGVQVNLQCWVKIRERWRDNENLLEKMGF